MMATSWEVVASKKVEAAERSRTRERVAEIEGNGIPPRRKLGRGRSEEEPEEQEEGATPSTSTYRTHPSYRSRQRARAQAAFPRKIQQPNPLPALPTPNLHPSRAPNPHPPCPSHSGLPPETLSCHHQNPTQPNQRSQQAIQLRYPTIHTTAYRHGDGWKQRKQSQPQQAQKHQRLRCPRATSCLGKRKNLSCTLKH